MFMFCADFLHFSPLNKGSRLFQTMRLALMCSHDFFRFIDHTNFENEKYIFEGFFDFSVFWP